MDLDLPLQSMTKTKAISTWISSSLLALILLGSCSSAKFFVPPATLPDDRQNIREPEYRPLPLVEDAFEYSIRKQTERIFDLSRYFRWIAGRPKQSFNVNPFDEVNDSSWFTNRNAREPMPLDAVSRGPNQLPGPETEGPWTISSVKEEGKTPGFVITDARGYRYLIKFDPPGYNELSSGAEVIVTKILYAAGYNVPENSIVYFDPDILKIGMGCLRIDNKGNKNKMTVDVFDRMMNSVNILADGTVRAMASKYLSGKPLGPFRYSGTRKDDPNDIVPHEHRRELRGLYPICAWLKHFDIKNANSLDMYIEEGSRKYVKHYLIDFGSTLGSSVKGPMADYLGHETTLDFNAMLENLLCLGIKVKSWETLDEVEFPSIGRYDDFDFKPGKTKMSYFNPAFKNMTDLDGYWGAKLVMSFSDDQLSAIVEQARYSNPSAASSLLEKLIGRRNKTGIYWFSRIIPLDKFRFKKSMDGDWILHFSDLGVHYKLWKKEETRIRYDFAVSGKKLIRQALLPSNTVLSLSKLNQIMKNSIAQHSVSPQEHREITFILSRDYGRTWSRWVKVFYNFDAATKDPQLIGIKRQE